jgi:hypothetical protein
MKPKHSPHAASPPLKDRIHCVAFVLDINSVNTLSDKMVAKLKKIRKDVVDCGKFCLNADIFEMITMSSDTTEGAVKSHKPWDFGKGPEPVAAGCWLQAQKGSVKNLLSRHMLAFRTEGLGCL